VFGRGAGEVVAAMLAEAEIDTKLNTRPLRFKNGRLEVEDGEPIACDGVISLPRPHVDPIPGLPQEKRDGFIPTDRFGGVLGLERVFAAGDATWFPIKQGGLAAQLADSCASAIAELAGADVDPQPFQPVLRGALLTEAGPRYMRTQIGVEHRDASARSPLWWPPAKVAGKYLAPYLAGRAGYPGAHRALDDLEPPTGEDAAGIDPGHADALAVALAFADENASEREFDRALRWLEVAEDLELYLPGEYERKRIAWEGLARGEQ
jgi:sulfide:quinone oxidoreductase